jgi:hypothetical protein
MPRLSHLAGGVALCLALPASASAAYAPKLSVSLDPATPSTAAAITTTVTQAAGESASKTVMLSFPSGFTVPLKQPDLTVCSPDQEQARACPDGSRMGDASATASVLGLPVALTGNVHFGGLVGDRFKLIVFLDNASLNQHVTVEGLVGVRPSDAGFDAVFDNLPDQLTTTFTLHLLGQTKALALTPATCGDQVFTGRFTSHAGEQATSQANVTIAGCVPPKLVVSPLDLEPSPASTRRGTTLMFNLTEAATVTLTAKHGGRQALRRTMTGRKGTNRVRGFGRWLKPGRYVVRVSALTGDGRSAARTKTLVLRRR